MFVSKTASRIKTNVAVVDQIQETRERHYANMHNAIQPKVLFGLIKPSACERAKTMVWSWLCNMNIAGLRPDMSISIREYQAKCMSFKSTQQEPATPDIYRCSIQCPCRNIRSLKHELNGVDNIFDSVTGLCLDCVVAMVKGSEESVCLNSHEQGLHRANAASTQSSS
jgi:hypothetical protein